MTLENVKSDTTQSRGEKNSLKDQCKAKERSIGLWRVVYSFLVDGLFCSPDGGKEEHRRIGRPLEYNIEWVRSGFNVSSSFLHVEGFVWPLFGCP